LWQCGIDTASLWRLIEEITGVRYSRYEKIIIRTRTFGGLGRCIPLWRVVTTGIPRIAATNSPDAAQGAVDCPVFLYRLDKIRAATWLKTAAATQHWADKPLVNAYQSDQQPRGKAFY
jgi:hypothetical protein